MWNRFAARGCRATFVVCAALAVSRVSTPQVPEEREDRAGGRRLEEQLLERQAAAGASVPVVLVGRVVTPEGASAERALVTSSAGGRALTDARGAYRLELELPLDAERVQVTAVAERAGSRFVASAEIATPGSGPTSAGTLLLQAGGCCQPSWVPTFGERPGVDAAVYGLATFDDGGGTALYACGGFVTAGGTIANRVARWDGAGWEPLGSGMGSRVLSLATFDDGAGTDLYVGGFFTAAGGVTADHVARWDGSSWSALSGGLNDAVRVLAVFDDGGGPALYAGGDFNRANGHPANRIAKWDGTSWSALGSGLDGVVRALAVFDDGGGPALYVGGDFTNAGGVPASRIAKWDGRAGRPRQRDQRRVGMRSTPATYDSGSGELPYAAGHFTTAGGGRRTTSRAGMARPGRSSAAASATWRTRSRSSTTAVARCSTRQGCSRPPAASKSCTSRSGTGRAGPR
jgi:hypothetical protein